MSSLRIAGVIPARLSSTRLSRKVLRIIAGRPYTAKNQCGPGQAPCSLSLAHQVVKFSFETHGAGEYRWQCFIPCGLASVDGNGHAMGTLGFMSGFLNVVA